MSLVNIFTLTLYCCVNFLLTFAFTNLKFMKKLFIIFVAIFSIYGTAFSQSFEGIVAMDLTAQGMSITQEYKIKGDKAVVELKMGGIPVQKMYMNGDKKEMYILMEKEQKIAMRVKLDENNNKDDKKQPKVTVTKETKDILGYKCTKVIMEDGQRVTNAWVTKELNIDFSKLSGGGRKGNNNGAIAKHGFPLELDGTDEKGGKIVMKATKIEKTTINDSVFPDLTQYQVQDMPSMGK